MSRHGKIRVLLVDDDNLIRNGFCYLVEQDPELSVVADVPYSTDIVPLVLEHKPDVVLLNGASFSLALETLLELRDEHELDLAILLLAERGHQGLTEAVLRGAHGVVAMTASPDHLWKAIHKVHEGELWVDRSRMAEIISSLHQPAEEPSPDQRRIATLTAREREVIGLLGEGLTTRQMAERLHLSESTIRHHFTCIYKKLHVTDRLDLLIFAYNHQLVELAPDEPVAPARPRARDGVGGGATTSKKRG